MRPFVVADRAAGDLTIAQPVGVTKMKHARGPGGTAFQSQAGEGCFGAIKEVITQYGAAKFIKM